MLLSTRDFAPIDLPALETTPLVSVLMSTYNRADFLTDALESVIAQTYPRWELLVCDDGSTDASRQILSAYQNRDERICVFFKEHGGQSSGLNVAFRHSSGALVCLLDSDDTFHPQKLERVVQALRKHPGCGLACHLLQRTNAANVSEGVIPLMAPLTSGWKGPEMLRQGGILGGLPHGGGVAFRRPLAERIFPLRESGALRNFGDTPIMRLAPLMAPITAIEEILGTYRKHGNNQSTAPSLRDYIDRELACYEAVWQLQRQYLASRHPERPNLLAPLTANGHFLQMAYLKARIMCDGHSEKHLRGLMRATPSPLLTEPPLWRFVFRIAPLVPLPFLVATLDLLNGQGRLKQVVATVRSKWRRIRPRPSWRSAKSAYVVPSE
jgi:hypothetical protein